MTLKTKIFFLFLLLLSSCKLESQDPYVRMVEKERFSKDSIFKFNGSETPLDPKEQRWFVRLNYFPPDSSYRVNARLEFLDSPKFVMMPNSRGEKEEYFKLGNVKFVLKGHKCSLPFYQQLKFMKDTISPYHNTYFMPFSDETNGKETYGGGRFMDLEYEHKNEIILDFNYAYNPYCAYNHNYTCPIPPLENHLDFRIEAGEKNYSKE
jgi:uncharacterized protein (DUF1684 family)